MYSRIFFKSIIPSMSLLAGMFLMSVSLSANAAQTNHQSFWDLLKSGDHFVLIRHALAPGGGDPANFTVDDCSTQRNLSNEGRAQAVAIGELFRANGIASARVLSSQWCRCLETARLMSLGEVEEFSTLNSFFQAYEREGLQTQQLNSWLSKQDLSVPTVLVTHQVNITALTNIFPGSGEIILVKRTKAGAFELARRYPTRT